MWTGIIVLLPTVTKKSGGAELISLTVARHFCRVVKAGTLLGLCKLGSDTHGKQDDDKPMIKDSAYHWAYDKTE